MLGVKWDPSGGERYHESLWEILHALATCCSSFLARLMNLGVLQCMDSSSLFSFARNQTLSVKAFLANTQNRKSIFPLSVTAAEQLLQLQQELNHLDLNAQMNDQWTYIWGPAIFSSKKGIHSSHGVLPNLSNFQVDVEVKLMCKTNTDFSFGCCYVTD